MILLDPSARFVVAHRGASGQWPENTLLAFRRGLEAGADALEFDVRLSGDGVPVVMHDATVDRTTDGMGEVAALSWRRMKALDAGMGERVPALEEVLAAFPGVPMIMEVKERRVSGPAILVLRRMAAGGRILVGAFGRKMLVPFRAAGLPTAASRWEVAAWWAMSRSGWIAPPRRWAAFSVPERSGRVRVVDRRFLRAAARAGAPVHVWTVDDRVTAERLWTDGVSGVITNFPERMRQ